MGEGLGALLASFANGLTGPSYEHDEWSSLKNALTGLFNAACSGLALADSESVSLSNGSSVPHYRLAREGRLRRGTGGLGGVIAGENRRKAMSD